INSDGCLPCTPIVYLGPGHTVILQELHQLGAMLSVVETHTEHFEPFGVIFVVGGHKFGHFLAAGPTPRSPKVEQHDFAFVIAREIDVSTVDCGGAERKRFLASNGIRPAGRGVASARRETDEGTAEGQKNNETSQKSRGVHNRRIACIGPGTSKS